MPKDDGLNYMHLTANEINIEEKKGNITLGNLFGGDKALGM